MTAVGGPGAVTRAMADAAREAGAEIRTGADVQRILVKDGAVTGVVLADGTEIAAATVVSGADPRRTFLGLIDPVELEPDFTTRIRNYRCPGTVAKVNFGLRGLPAFRGVTGDPAASLRGRVQVGPGIDYLERAFDASKYGETSAVAVSRRRVPVRDRSVDGAVGPSRDVGAHAVRPVQAAHRILERTEGRAGGPRPAHARDPCSGRDRRSSNSAR